MAKQRTEQEQVILRQRVQLYGGVFLMFLLALAFIWAYRLLTVRKVGVHLEPEEAVAPISVTFYRQNDPLWAQDPIGETGYAMGEEGSLFTCLAMALERQGVTMTPGEINAAVTAKGLYDEQKRVQMDRISEVCGGVGFLAPATFESTDILPYLKDGQPVMLRVNRTEGVHWLLAVGAADGDFLVLDPLGDGQAVALSGYGNVFAMGVPQRMA